MQETDLYPAVKRFLENQGYDVKSEIRDCDVVAVREEENPLIVEMKNTLSLSVILQAVQRTAMSDTVYVAVPRDCSPLRTHYKPVLKLLRMLGLGLLAVHTQSRPPIVEALLDPGPYAPRLSRPKRSRLLREFAQRVGDPNQGGADRRRGIMTAYRQKALRIARHLQANGPTKAALVAAAISEPKTRDILYRNVYGWFDRIETGVYSLSPRGQEETALWPAASPESVADSPVPHQALPTDRHPKRRGARSAKKSNRRQG
jgi:hypothetical protein